MFQYLIKFIYQPRCSFCQKIIDFNSKEDTYYACKNCKKTLKYLLRDTKFRLIHNKSFDYLISTFNYKDVIRQKLIEFKFYNKKYLYGALSEQLLFSLLACNLKIDYIIAVPISLSRFLERGYNQSYLIAKFLSTKLQIKLLKYHLIKIKNNKRQSELSEFERIQNTKNVYKVINKHALVNKNILLIDDIYTTGSTVNECSKVLKEAGARVVIVATIARA